MQFRNLLQSGVRNSGFAAALFATVVNPIAPLSVNAQTRSTSTASPIKHVIVILGENRTFDHIFATYVPKQGETVSNLLSKGIVNADGTPGTNYYFSDQYKAYEPAKYSISPAGKVPYDSLPPVVAGGPKTPYSSPASRKRRPSSRSRFRAAATNS
jgi:phospholipase C